MDGSHKVRDGERARGLLAPGRTSSTELAEHASHACARLVMVVSRLLGETAARNLLERSMVKESARFSWLGDALPHDERTLFVASLRRAMASQDPTTITIAFGEVSSTFLGLVRDLIGDELVDRLLRDM